ACSPAVSKPPSRRCRSCSWAAAPSPAAGCSSSSFGWYSGPAFGRLPAGTGPGVWFFLLISMTSARLMPRRTGGREDGPRNRCAVAFGAGSALRMAVWVPGHPVGGLVMLRWALIFLIVAIVAAVFGFGGIAGDAAWIAKILFFLFLIVAVVSMLAGRGRTGTLP